MLNSIPIYQHPYVDIFKAVKLTEWQTAHKEGDIQGAVWDKQLGKSYVRIQGTSSSSNYIQVPAQKFLPKKALGLTGKYIYLMMQTVSGKNCVIHLDYMVNETRLTKVSLSTIYKEFKNINGSSLQIPLNIQPDKWTVVCIDIAQLLTDNNIFIAGQKQQSFFLRSFQICSTANVRGVYTSDIAYQVHSLHKDLQFKVPKDQAWFAHYNWVQFPKGPEGNQDITEHLDNQIEQINIQDETKPVQKARVSSRNGSRVTSKRPMSSTGKKSDANAVAGVKKQVGLKPPGSVKGSSKKPGLPTAKSQKSVRFDEEASGDLTKINGQGAADGNSPDQMEATTEDTIQNKQRKFDPDEIEEQNGQIEKTMKEIETLKEDYNWNLEAKNINKKVEVTLYQGDNLYDANQVNAANDPSFVLKPNPIMRLDRVVGWHPHYTSSQVYFNHDPKLSQEIIFSQANMMLGFYPPLQKQRLFYERQTNNIDQLFVESTAGGDNYAFTICKSLEEKSKDNEVTVWSLVNLDTTNTNSSSIMTFKPPLKIIHSMSLSCGNDPEYLCIGGKDLQMRDTVLVYKFQDMIRFKKVEIHARQMIDFDTYAVKFNPNNSTSIVACGKENIKLFKIKNGHLPGQSIILNNTARGKYFRHITFQHAGGEQQNGAQGKQQSYIFIGSEDGLLYFINFHTRQVDKVIQIHEEPIAGLKLARTNEYIASVSKGGTIRLWSTDFENLKSEVKTGTIVDSCDINYDGTQICVVSVDSGTISVLDLNTSSYNVVLRTHTDHVTDLAHNVMTGKLVTLGQDYCVKVWNAETMEQINEFVSERDMPVRVVCQNQGLIGEEAKDTHHTDTLIAIGFKSGFIRIIDLDTMAVVHETLLFQSPVMDIAFSNDNKFMAVFFKSGKIVIINKSRAGVFQPVKNIDYDLPNQNYCSLSFSMDSSMLANISSNANTITIWETRNFSLRYHLDITGDIISKIAFAPNGRDIVLLTTSSKLKFYRLGASARDEELQHIKDSYDVTDMECVDFHITSNNKFIICAGKEGVIKVYDYFMRGGPVASTQAFLGHYKYPRRLCVQKDLKNVYSCGEFNGIFKWTFYGDPSDPHDFSAFCEELPGEKEARARMTQDDLLKQRVDDGMFDQEELAKYTQNQLDKYNQQLNNASYNNQQINSEMLTQNMAPNQSQIQKSGAGSSILTQQQANPFIHTIDLNKGGYCFEQFEMRLAKVLACSSGPQVYNNLLWHEQNRYIAYTIQNVIVIEQLNQQKTQKLLKEGNDQIHQLKLSASQRYLLAWSKTGPMDGFPCIYIFDSQNFKKLNQIAISDAQIDAVEFSAASNMLLVVSSTRQGEEQIISTITVWDFIDGHKDIFCKSMVPIPIIAGAWNPYMDDKRSGDEFVTISQRCYHYWQITPNLQLQYQEGELPAQTEGFRDKHDAFTCLTYVKPDQLHHSVYLLIGLKSGYVWLTDTRVNQFLFKVKVLDDALGGVQRIFSSHVRIIVEPKNGAKLYSWDQSGKNGEKEYSPHNPFNFFIGKEQQLSLDGNFKASHYDGTGNQIMALSTAGSIWYLNFIENATLRIKSCHWPTSDICACDYKYVSPNEFNIEEEQEDGYTFDQNYQVATASEDGQIKMWSMYDLEYGQQFLVPKEKCIYIAMHQFKPYMICSFTDGYVRFFDLGSSKLLGRVQVHSGIEDQNPDPTAQNQKTFEDGESIVDYIISMKILPSGNHVLAATRNGQVILIFVQSWSPLSIRMISLVSIHTAVNAFEFSYLEPYNKWLIATANGKVIVYNRKDFNSLNQEIFDELNPPVFNYMDSFNLLDFVSNNYTQTKRCNTLDHYYSMAKRNLVYNEVDPMHECEGVFSKTDLTLHLCFIRQSNMLMIRNFELHQVVKKIEISSTSLPVTMQLMPHGSSPFICVAMQDKSLVLIDYMNDENKTKVETMHDELKTMKVCPNGRYVLTGGNRGDITLWTIKKKILDPNLYQDVVRTDAQF